MSNPERAFVSGLLALLVPIAATAQERVRFEAKSVEIDPVTLRVTLRDRVVIRAGRARVTSDHLTLTLDRDHSTARFVGPANVALCPCPDPPVRLSATSGTLDAGGDVTLRDVRLEVLQTPVFGLPIVILRQRDKIGLLPPVLAWRADAGFTAGAGVHLPWDKTTWIDARGAVYSKGGGAFEARFAAPWTSTSIDVSVLGAGVGSTRVEAQSRGVIELGQGALGRVSAAWDADVIRGERARSGSVDLERAAALDDHAAIEIALRPSNPLADLFVAPGFVMRGERGTGTFLAGPRASIGAVGKSQTFTISAVGMVLGEPGSALTIPFGRVEASGEANLRPGPLDLRFALRTRARALGVIPRDAWDVGGAAEVDLGLPLARAFDKRSDGLRLTHWITPGIVIRATGYTSSDPLDQLGARASALLSPFSFLGAGSLSSVLGYWLGPSARVDLRGGAVAGSGGARALGHGRLAIQAPLIEVHGDVALTGPSKLEALGAAATATVRVGPLAGPAIGLDLATSAGSGGGMARLVATGSWAALPAETYNPLTTKGTTLGMEVLSPRDRALQGAARLDLDLSPAQGEAPRALAVRALGEYRHPCACWGISMMLAHRLGRPGVDVMTALDLGGLRVAPPAGAWGGASNALHFPR